MVADKSPFPWLNVEFKHSPPKADGFSLAVWIWWAVRLLVLFAALKVLSMLI